MSGRKLSKLILNPSGRQFFLHIIRSTGKNPMLSERIGKTTTRGTIARMIFPRRGGSVILVVKLETGP